MKNLLPAIVALLACLTLQSCPSLGRTADPVALFGPAQLSWSDVKTDLEEGYATGESSEQLTLEDAAELRIATEDLEDAIQAKDIDAVRMIPWPAMYPWADVGIDAQLARGLIGPGVADSFRVHDVEFDKVMQRLRRVTP